MDSVDTLAGGSQLADAYVFTSRPHHSLPPRQARQIFWSLALLCLGVATVFSLHGYWLILPFAGLEIGILAWAFEQLKQHAGDYETLTIRGDDVVLEWHCGTGRGRREFNRAWAQVECVCRAPGRDCHVCLCSHGRGSEVGVFLSDDERVALAKTLKQRLAQRAAVPVS
jgi:uncharacterized membrane protein